MVSWVRNSEGSRFAAGEDEFSWDMLHFSCPWDLFVDWSVAQAVSNLCQGFRGQNCPGRRHIFGDFGIIVL